MCYDFEPIADRSEVMCCDFEPITDRVKMMDHHFFSWWFSLNVL